MTDGRSPPPDNADPLAAVVALVLADTTLQARLGRHEIPEDYLADLLAVAASHGIALDVETVRAAMRPTPVGMSAFMPSPVTLEHWPPVGWLPARTVHTGAAPAFDWAWFGPEALTAPFYEDEVRHFASRPFSRMFRTRTSLAAVVGDMPDDAPAPAGFIHHMSRCGSTLVAQLLAADPDNVVLSEAEPLDAVLRWGIESGAPPEQQIAALRGIAAALGRDRSGHTRRVFFKLDSWHTVALPLFRAAFPDTPWVFLYRDPLEVLVSQQRMRGVHTVAGLVPVSVFPIPDADRLAGDHYAGLVLAHTMQAVLDHWPAGGGMLVDYAEMPDAILTRIAPHFGLAPDAASAARMRQVATRSAKTPGETFVPDSAAKQAAASPESRAAARDLVDPVYVRLTELRAHTG